MKASCRYFHVEELRHPLPMPNANGFISVTELVSMLYKPVPIPFKVLASCGISYYHEFVFIHIKQVTYFNKLDLECCDKTAIKCPRIILEGWLVFLYYTVIQTGALSAPQSATINFLLQNAWILGLNTQDFLRITTCINNLIILVNKAMEDGFTLNEACCSSYIYRQWRGTTEPQAPKDSSVYLRLLWNGAMQNPFKAGVDFLHRNHDIWNGPWIEVLAPKRIDRILDLCKNSDIRFSLGFVLIATNSFQLQDLEESWSRRQLPSCNVPLLDWQIKESL